MTIIHKVKAIEGFADTFVVSGRNDILLRLRHAERALIFTDKGLVDGIGKLNGQRVRIQGRVYKVERGVLEEVGKS